jgi:amidase
MAFGWCAGDEETACSTDVVRMMEEVSRALRAAGLQDIFMPHLLAGGCARYNQLRDLDVLAEVRQATQGAESRLAAATRSLIDRPPVVDAVKLSQAWESALQWRAEFLNGLQQVAVAIAPVAPGDATGHDGTLTVEGQLLGPLQLMAYCRAVSLTGLPVVSVPCGSSSRGLPLSVQVIGRPFAEADVLAVGGLLERLFGGARLAPRLSASTGTLLMTSCPMRRLS